MTLYVFEADTFKVVAEFEGNDWDECLKLYGESDFTDTELYGYTGAPRFDCGDGLHY